MATKTIGSGGDFTTLGGGSGWCDYIKALGTLTENEVGILTDNAAYPISDASDTNFLGVTLNGYTITLKATTNKHDGSLSSGARVTSNVAYGGPRLVNIIVEDVEFHSLHPDGHAITNSYNCTLRRCLGTSPEKGFTIISAGAELEACRVTISTNSGWGIRSQHSSTIIHNCSVFGATTGYSFTASSHTGSVKNNLAYNCTTDWSYTALTDASNNASEDGTHPGTSGVTITANPFEADGYTASGSGQLDDAGIDLGITADAANNGYSVVPAIGAYEANASGVIEIRNLYWNPDINWKYVIYDGGLIPDDSILFYESGSHTSSDGQASLTDSSKTWATNQWVGFKLRNISDGSEGVITSNAASNITATLSGGTNNDWDTGDRYQIVLNVDTDDQIVYEINTNNGGKVISMSDTGVPAIFGPNGNHSFDVKIRDVSDSNSVSTFTVTITV